MAEFLLELFSEEIPARMQHQAARDLERLSRAALAAADLEFTSVESFSGPRRLTLVVDGLPLKQADRIESRRGPKVGAPAQALDGFLRSTGVARTDLVERDGTFYADLPRPGRPTGELLAEITTSLVNSFPWPKSMRSGTSSFRWIRPLRRITCVFDGAVVPVEIGAVASSDLTEGHRFMTPGPPIRVCDFTQYKTALAVRSVILDAKDRKARIASGAEAVCATKGLELVPDQALLDELAGLAEWPTPMLGDMDPAFLDLPAEVIRTSMRTHQKYFAVRDPATQALAPHFVVVANIEPVDGGGALAAGNAKVLSARLNDARFFWREDQKVSLEARLAKLDGVVFHARLGTLRARAERIEGLASRLAARVGADPILAAAAGRLAKADLTTGMVGEFPELQGVMGGYYARLEGRREGDFPNGAWSAGLDAAAVDAVADAVRDHYRPVGPADAVPTAPTTVAVALADKLDTLTGFFAINERPTGSKDPYGLRRAALGVIRIVLHGRIALSLRAAIDEALEGLLANGLGSEERRKMSELAARAEVREGLTAFFADRLKAALKDEGRRHDLVDAVFALGDDDMLSISDRVEGLSSFLLGEDGASLLSGYRRAVNILKAEDKRAPAETQAAGLGHASRRPPEETALEEILRAVAMDVDAALGRNDYVGAMRQLAKLRPPVDAFFEKVLVNDPDPVVRSLRLKLLTQVRDTANRVADFSLISG